MMSTLKTHVNDFASFIVSGRPVQCSAVCMCVCDMKCSSNDEGSSLTKPHRSLAESWTMNGMPLAANMR